MNEDIVSFRKQHLDNYRNAVLENINNNTIVLVDEDITSLLKKPPLDSMDLIKSKFLSLAKKNKIVLDTEVLSDMLDMFHENLLYCCEDIKKMRIIVLGDIINKTKLKDLEVFKFNKKDFTALNKKIRKIIKDIISDSYETLVLNRIDKLFVDGTDDAVKNKIIQDISKYVKGNYKNQILENLDIKILVKDTTLINSTKEQADRYLFTLNNSRLLNDLQDAS